MEHKCQRCRTHFSQYKLPTKFICQNNVWWIWPDWFKWGLKRCYCHFLTHSHTVRWAQVHSMCKSLVLKGIYTFKWNFPVHFAVTFALNCIHRSLYAEFQMRIHLQNAKPFHILRYALNAIHSSVTICITRAVAIAKSSNIFNSLRCILHITQLTLRTAYT